MMMQESTAKKLHAELGRALADHAEGADVELSPQAAALIHDAVARDDLDRAIAEAK